jgi:para-aminobenzoate synthetase
LLTLPDILPLMPLVRRLDTPPDPERAFVHIYGASRNAFWLDSSAPGERGRFSFMGDGEGPHGALVTYDVTSGLARVERRDGVEQREEAIFDLLGRELERWGAAADELPFEFDCGFAGYLGYELKAECDGAAAHLAPTPDAAFVFADRLIAFDHDRSCAYLLALAEPGGEAEAERWLAQTSARLEALPALGEPAPSPRPLELRLRRSRGRYLRDVGACQRYLAAGHSYEICLTNKVVGEGAPEPLDLYRALRRANPSPFAAYLSFGDLAVLSSSPERLLAVDRGGWAEARPIKGTSRRGQAVADDEALAAALRADPKARAENVTIVDLMRNDLGRVCEAGTVAVPELMRVERYETVHQLVSSVRGRLRRGVGAVECLRACFPPGSMTGAPKRRTMEIIDELEGEARGVYSGAIGWFGLGGACDFSVAIRTIVVDGGTIEVGAGGAIVVDSNPEDEFEEMLLKARAPIAAIDPQASLLGQSLSKNA